MFTGGSGGTTSNFTTDVSMTSRLVVGGDVSFNSRLFLNSNSLIINGVMFSASGGIINNNNGIFTTDVSMTSRLVVGGDVSLNSRLFVTSDCVVTGNFYMNSSIVKNYQTDYYLLWSNLSSNVYKGTNGAVFASAIDSVNNFIYVAGEFTRVYDATNTTGLTVNNIARWSITNNVWQALGNASYNGTNDRICALALDSVNNKLYAGGAFSRTYDNVNTTGLITNYIAAWDISNSTWSILGTNNSYNGTSDDVYALELDSVNNILYVGGNFLYINDPTGLYVYFVAAYSTVNNTWSALGNSQTTNVPGTCGTNSTVYSLLIDPVHNKLYVGGNFSQVYYGSYITIIASYIGLWYTDTSTWGSISTGNNVYSNNYNGLFNSADIVVNTISHTSPTRVTGVYAMKLDNNNHLYVGGNFDTAYDYNSTSGLCVNNIALFDIAGNGWTSLGQLLRNGTDGAVYSMIFNSSLNNVLAAGVFKNTYSSATSFSSITKAIASYTTVSNIISNVSSSSYGAVNGVVYATAFDNVNNLLYVAGQFNSVYDSVNTNGLIASNIAVWDIANNIWRTLGNYLINGTDTLVNALELDTVNNLLYVGGTFSTVFSGTNASNLGQSANNIAIFDLTNLYWNILGSNLSQGVNGSVSSIVLDSTRSMLYVGGTFSSVNDSVNTGGLLSNNIAIWDIFNSVWNLFGTSSSNGVNGAVSTISLDSAHNMLYVGGAFTRANDSFNTSAGLLVNYITAWDFTTTRFKVLGSSTKFGLNGRVNSLLIKNSKVYAGGAFTTAYDSVNTNGISVNNVAVWNYTTWAPFGTSTRNGATFAATPYSYVNKKYTVSTSINSLAWDPSYNYVYVAGNFNNVTDNNTNVSGLSVNNIAAWDTVNNVWKAMGSGTNLPVYSLITSGTNKLYIGGAFKSTTNTTNSISIWDATNNVWKYIGNSTYNGVNGRIYTLNNNASTNITYVGGSFTSVNDSVNSSTALQVNNIASLQYTSFINPNLYTVSTVNPFIALAGDASFNGRFFVGGDLSLNSKLSVVKDAAISNRLVVGGDVSFNNRLFVSGDVSFNKRVFVSGDVSFNNRLFVNGNVVFNNRLFVQNDVSFNSRLSVKLNITTGSTNVTSDYRIKDNVITLGTNDTVDNINPVKYYNKVLNKQDIGVIAHELQEYYPFLVNGAKDAAEFQSVNYTGLIGLLINEVKLLKNLVKQTTDELVVTRTDLVATRTDLVATQTDLLKIKQTLNIE